MNYTSRDNKISQVLSSISDEELARFARNYALVNEAFSLALIEKYWMPEEGNYREMVEACFAHPSCLGKYASTFLDWSEISHDLAALMKRADEMKADGDAVGAVLIARNVLVMTCEEYEHDTTPVYPSSPEWKQRLLDVLCKAVDTIRVNLTEEEYIDKDTQMGILQELIADLKKMGKCKLYRIELLVDEWLPFTLSPKKFIKYIDGKLKKASGLDWERFALQKMKYLVRNGMREEAERCLPELSRRDMGKVRDYYFSCLVEWKEYRKAIDLLDANTDDFAAYYHRWDDKLLEVIRLLDDRQEVINECRKHFMKSQYRMKWYEALKEMTDASEWDSFIKDLLSECSFDADLDHAEAHIYIAEGMYDQLIKFFDKNDYDFEHFKNFGKYLPEDDQMIVMDRYVERVKNLSMGMKDRKSYKHLATWLYKLANVTSIGDQKLAKLVRWLQNTHCGRPAMMEEIDRVIKFV